MTNTVRNILIVSASVVGTGIINAACYFKGRKDGIALAAKQTESLNAAPAVSGNVRTSQQQQQHAQA